MTNHIEWGEGPWNHEPDHAVWIDEATGLDVMINRGPSGALCGYVGIGPSHPWHGMEYSEVDHLVNAHGGLTYSDKCQEGGEICHVPAEGREHDIWWFGFDCAHHLDYAPGMEARMRQLQKEHPAAMSMAKTLGNERFMGILDGKYRDWAYVTKEVTQLAAQLARQR